jgi:hypothetical protein
MASVNANTKGYKPMLKKIIVSVLVVTVLGAAGTALAYNVINPAPEADLAAVKPLASDQELQVSPVVGLADQAGTGLAAGDLVGDPWQEMGLIGEIDDYGFQFSLQDGENVYVELGPPDYWQNQGVVLEIGQTATIIGMINEGMIHATQVVLEDGQILQLRDEIGQPLWSGGVDAYRGGEGAVGDGEHIPDPQAQVDEWVTLEGILMAFQSGYMTMSTADGEIVTFQTGQPRFFSSQGITFSVGDEIVVVGFYENDQFMAGDITQVSTGLRVLLRDPNGRPLWAGPGSGNGNGGNGGNGGSGNGGHQ